MHAALVSIILLQSQSVYPELCGNEGAIYGVRDDQTIMVCRSGDQWTPLLSENDRETLEKARVATDPSAAITLQKIQGGRYILGEFEAYAMGAITLEISHPFLYDLKTRELAIFRHVSEVNWVACTGKHGIFETVPHQNTLIEMAENAPPRTLSMALPAQEATIFGQGMGAGIDSAGRIYANQRLDESGEPKAEHYDGRRIWNVYENGKWRKGGDGRVCSVAGQFKVISRDQELFLRGHAGDEVKIPVHRPELHRWHTEVQVTPGGWVMMSDGHSTQVWHPKHKPTPRSVPEDTLINASATSLISDDGWLITIISGNRSKPRWTREKLKS